MCVKGERDGYLPKSVRTGFCQNNRDIHAATHMHTFTYTDGPQP